MANKVVFTIEGNSTKAVAAINRVATNFSKLNSATGKLNQSTTRMANQYARAFMALERRVASLEGKLQRTNAKLEKSRAEITKLKDQLKGVDKNADQATDSLNKTAIAASKVGSAYGSWAGKALPKGTVQDAFANFKLPTKSPFATLNAGMGAFIGGMGKATVATGALYSGIGKFLTFSARGLGKFRDAWMGGIDAIRLTAQSISNLGRYDDVFLLPSHWRPSLRMHLSQRVILKIPLFVLEKQQTCTGLTLRQLGQVFVG